MEIKVADVAELVDARDLKSLDGNVVWVRLPPPAPTPQGDVMPDDQNNPFGEDGDDAVDDFERLSQLLFQRVVDFADEEEVAAGLLSPLLLRLAVTMRMMDCGAATAKPSGGGLKLDLDRFRRDIENIIRETKKDADRFVAEAKES